MNEIFGIPMSAIMVVLVALLAVCLLGVAWIAWRRPVVFKLGVRNIPRRPAQTVLIVVGLMLSTLLIAAALGTGDTIDHSMSADVYDNLGHVDQLIVSGEGSSAASIDGAGATFDAATAGEVAATLAGNDRIDGMLPLLEARAPVAHPEARLAEPEVVLVGLDPAALTSFALTTIDGRPLDLARLGADQVVLSEKLAEQLAAGAGDRVTVFYDNRPLAFTVAAVAEDGYLVGVRRNAGNGIEIGGLALPLARLQALVGLPGAIGAIAVSNAGGVRDSLEQAEQVVADLEAAVTGRGLAVDPVKRDLVEQAALFASIFTALFLVLGLFSIAAGVLLIVLIFTMLASERRAEMGMARAIGARRGLLVQQFVAEGAGYALLAGLVGAGLGALAAVGIAYGMRLLFGDFLPVEPYVAPRSLVVAYCLGVVITFASVVAASWRISRLNVVAAIRDLPDVASPARKTRTLVWAALLLLAGGALTWLGTDTGSLFPYATGMSLLPFGLALGLRFFGVPSRPVFTLVGLYLLFFWLLPDDLFTRIFGDYTGDIEMFFLSGIFMVVAATIVIVNNLDLLLAGVGRLGGLFRGTLPAIRTAIAYPGAAKSRTGLTIAMFSLIVFSLVMTATMTANFTALFLGDAANAGWDVRADALSANPIADFEGALAAGGVETSGFAAVGTTVNPSAFFSQLRVAGGADGAWKEYAVYGMDDGFIAGSEFLFAQRARGYETDAAIVEALRTEPNVAIVDAIAVAEGGGFGGGEEMFALTGLAPTDKVFAPITVELANPQHGPPQVVTVIGVLDSKISSLFGLYAHQDTIAAVYPTPVLTSYYVTLADPALASEVARAIEAALLTNGVQATSIRDQLAESQRQSTGFLYLIQGFMGLGLVVGVAAVGVIAFRSVVERRQQIGVLRAIGFQRSLVSLSFLIETAFVVGLGVLSGTILGLILARNLFASDDLGVEATTFLVPWGIILLVLVATVVVALLMTWIPARQAGRIAPAEALRYE